MSASTAVNASGISSPRSIPPHSELDVDIPRAIYVFSIYRLAKKLNYKSAAEVPCAPRFQPPIPCKRIPVVGLLCTATMNVRLRRQPKAVISRRGSSTSPSPPLGVAVVPQVDANVSLSSADVHVVGTTPSRSLCRVVITVGVELNALSKILNTSDSSANGGGNVEVKRVVGHAAKGIDEYACGGVVDTEAEPDPKLELEWGADAHMNPDPKADTAAEGDIIGYGLNRL
ncbi:hypothetical protein C8F04DRAFT_1193846 [Mycena alexandri]|uniref:Uncharacterized protein n=1 Tax=Mycena alexandri TaxID=1745969 RepID=A0AAD6S885_9AGAR|nr:hypothetical protein C8F04DRAFT_1193846 [Mycena alexandri]